MARSALARFSASVVDQVARFHERRVAKLGDADPDQPEARPVELLQKQVAAGAKDAVGEVGMRVEMDVARARAGNRRSSA